MAAVFEADGFTFQRQRGSHRSYTRPGCARPVVIPTYAQIDRVILQGNMRTAGMSRERFFELYEKVR